MQNKKLTRFISAAMLGTFLEFFEISLYSFAANKIAAEFFPTTNSFVAVMSTWSIFAVSYLMRPLGAIWFGRLADSKNPKLAMQLSLLIMSMATVCIGLIPSYNKIGILAPIILLIMRILQSIAVSPEYNLPSVLIKNNNWCEHNFNFVSSISAAVTGLGIMSASLITAKFINYPSAWRWLFVVSGLTIGCVGLYLRAGLDNLAQNLNLSLTPLRNLFKLQYKDLTKGIILAGYIGCVSYVLFSFLVYALQNQLDMPLDTSLLVLSNNGFLLPLFCLISGYLADKISWQKIMLAANLAIGLLSINLFNNLSTITILDIKLLTAGLLASLGLFAGCFPGLLASIFARSHRYTGAFLSYNIGMSWIGGFSPLVFISSNSINYRFPGLIVLVYSLLVFIIILRYRGFSDERISQLSR